jgi:hypothetical protein
MQDPVAYNSQTLDWDLYTVQYLHRTVKDYIESPELCSKLESALISPYNPHVRHCVGLLEAVKIESIDPAFLDYIFWRRID